MAQEVTCCGQCLPETFSGKVRSHRAPQPHTQALPASHAASLTAECVNSTTRCPPAAPDRWDWVKLYRHKRQQHLRRRLFGKVVIGEDLVLSAQRTETRGIRQPRPWLYLGDVGVTDLCHDVTNELQNKETGIQATQIEFVFHVIVYYLSPTHHVLQRSTKKRREGRLAKRLLEQRRSAGDPRRFSRHALFPKALTTVFLAREAALLIIHLNSQNISVWNKVLPLLVVKCVHLQIKILI